MCYGFSCVITRDLRIGWCQPDYALDGHHDPVMKYMGIDYSNTDYSDHVRYECQNWKIGTWNRDYPMMYEDIPQWFRYNEVLIKARVKQVLRECEPILISYKKARRRAKRLRSNALGPAMLHLDFNDYNKLLAKLRKTEERAYDRMIEKLSKIEGFVQNPPESKV